VSLLITLVLFANFNRHESGYQFVHAFAGYDLWVFAQVWCGRHFETLLCSLGSFVLRGVCFQRIHEREKEYYILFLA